MCRIPHLPLILVGCSSSLVAQTPEVLLTAPLHDCTHRFVDRDGDGRFLGESEHYDYQFHTERAFTYLLSNLSKSADGTLYWPSYPMRSIFRARDDDADGMLGAGEVAVFFDVQAAFGGGYPKWTEWSESEQALYWLVWSGSGQSTGVWRSVDSNGDGDAMDPRETTPALRHLEGLIPIGNTPLSGPVELFGAEFRSIDLDPYVGQRGRFLVHSESWHCFFSLEDANGNGSFRDPGEVDLFCHLFREPVSWPRPATADLDLHPDVLAGLLPSTGRMLSVRVVMEGGQPVYYMGTGVHGSGAASLIYRAVDRNVDGDVNDAGEITVFFDGRSEYHDTYGMDVMDGTFILYGRHVSMMSSRLFALRDLNGDHDAMDPGEVEILWELAPHEQMMEPLCVRPGELAPPPPGLPGRHANYGDPTCASSLSVHRILVGADEWRDRPLLGTRGFVLRTEGGSPFQPGFFAVGLSNTVWNGMPLPIPLDARGTCSIFTALGFVAANYTTDGAGMAHASFDIPSEPLLLELETYWQALTLDPTSGIGCTLSDGAWIRLGFSACTCW